MRVVIVLIGSAVGALETFAGYRATHSFWSYGITIPLAAVTGFVVGKTAAEL